MSILNDYVDRTEREAASEADRARKAREGIAISGVCAPFALAGTGWWGKNAKEFWDFAREWEKIAYKHEARAEHYAAEAKDTELSGLRGHYKQKTREYTELAAQKHTEARHLYTEAGISASALLLCAALAASPLFFWRAYRKHKKLTQEKQMESLAARQELSDLTHGVRV